MKTIIVSDKTARLPKEISGVPIISSQDFFSDQHYQNHALKIINLCGSYGYQNAGYYVSLLASARGQKVVPDIETILDIESKFFLKLRSDKLDDLIQKSLKDLQSKEFVISIYFGKNVAKKYDKLANELYKSFHIPLARARFKLTDKWRLQSLSPIGLKDVPESHIDDLSMFASEFFQRRQIYRKQKASRFDLAILVNPDEAQPPSNEAALKKFAKAAEKLEISSEFINKNDFHRLAEFDGLFIRETTQVNHHTFRFSQKAKSLGMVVVDDPLSILRCTNKVYLAELFHKHKIGAPQTRLIHRESFQKHLNDFTFPLVAKVPDSAFSRGVVKIESKEELRESFANMFESSAVILTQEFIPTEFDWRIGILNGQPLYGCKYFMSRSHWQIYHHLADGKVEDGSSETYHIEQVPLPVVRLAEKAAKLIGNGFYGVDLKVRGDDVYIIEINDNPSIDAGCEDLVLGTALYEKVMMYMRDQMEKIALGRTI